MLGEPQVAAPLMAQRAAHGALRLAHRRFQPGEGVGIQFAGLWLSGKPKWSSQCQFGHETPVLAFALFAPAASRPGQHCAVWRQRGRQVAPCGHMSTVGQRSLRLVLRDDQSAGAAVPNIHVQHWLDNPARTVAGGGPMTWEGCQPTAQGRSLPGLSTAQMRVIWPAAISNAYTATVRPSCWATRPGWPLTVRSRNLTLPGAARARSAR
jgi:hypothetical protein